MRGYRESLAGAIPQGIVGRVSRVTGRTIAVEDFPAPIASWAVIDPGHGCIPAEVVGFQQNETILQPFAEPTGVRTGQAVRLTRSRPTQFAGNALLGRVIDALGNPLDGRPMPVCRDRLNLQPDQIKPLDRKPIEQPFETGVRVIDSLLTCGRGQRLGLFAGSGVGKSTLLGQLARTGKADVNVVVLVGERGREVKEFLDRDLGAGLSKSVVVVATSDEPAPARLRAAMLGTSLAEYFRDRGNDVLLLMDSVTRFALAAREIALAAGEPPATRGFPPSVFAQIPRLLERSGSTESGSITAFYSVLVEGDDFDEPITDAVRGTLDGHVILSRQLAEQHHWPAIDVLGSISRCMPELIAKEHSDAASSLRAILAAHRRAEDLIDLGAYQHGSNPQVDAAIQFKEAIAAFLTQSSDVAIGLQQAISELHTLAALLASPIGGVE